MLRFIVALFVILSDCNATRKYFKSRKIDKFDKFYFIESNLSVSKPEFTFRGINDKNRWNNLANYHQALYGIIEEINFSFVTENLAKISGEPIMNVNGTFFDSTQLEFGKFLTPTYQLRSCFLFRNPYRYRNIDINSKPFSLTTWLAILITIFTFSLLLKINVYFNRIEYSWMRIVFETISIFCQQGTFVPLKKSYLFLTTFLLFSSLIYGYYTSNMLILLFNYAPPNYRTVRELIGNDFKIGIDQSVGVINWIQTNKKHEIHELFTDKMDIYETRDGLERVAQGGFAYYTDISTGYAIIGGHFQQEPLCDLAEVQMMPSKFIGFVIAKKFVKYYENLQRNLTRVLEVGILRKHEKFWDSPKAECYESQRFVIIELETVLLPFYCLFCGVLSSLLLVLFEIIWRNF